MTPDYNRTPVDPEDKVAFVEGVSLGTKQEVYRAEAAMAAHHHLVMVHPFVDGNGRITRLFADLLLYSLTSQYTFDWEPVIGSQDYFSALQEADQTMSPDALLRVVGLIDLATS